MFAPNKLQYQFDKITGILIFIRFNQICQLKKVSQMKFYLKYC